ncbi:MAG: ABC transporter substrate-binding protein [Spirochaetes bacterium]|nr:ABC transporter substrate-binding protein [Spirochaetota bacterium]
MIEKKSIKKQGRRKKICTAVFFKKNLIVNLLSVLIFIGIPFIKATAAEPIKVGAVLSITGWGGFIGTPMQKAMIAIVEDTNKKGGINGRPIELYIEDDKSNPTNAVIAATKLARDMNVSILTGPAITDSGMAMIPVAQREKVPFAVSGPVISSFKKWCFHVTPSDIINDAAVLEYGVKSFKAKRIAVIHDTANFGMTGMKVFRDEISKYPGSSIIIEEKYDTTDTSVIPQLMNIKAANPDVILAQSSGAQAAIIAKNYYQLGMKTPVVAPPGAGSPEFLDIAAKAAEKSPWIILGGKIMVAEQLPLSDPWRKNIYEPFKEVMKNKYPKESLMVFHAIGNDAIQIVIAALKEAGSDNRKAIRDALETIRCEVTTGPYACTAKDHRGITVYNGMPVVVRDGGFVLYRHKK